MLHHASFCARDPALVAEVLAEMLAATVLRAPAPPFPPNSWFVLYGDEAGSFIEILPWQTVLTPDSRFGTDRDDAMRPFSGAHVLLSTPRSAVELETLAARHGWPTQRVDARLFKVIKLWIEKTALVEFLTPDARQTYVDTFGGAGISDLDAKLRRLENPGPA
jgi:hypothetical protein